MRVGSPAALRLRLRTVVHEVTCRLRESRDLNNQEWSAHALNLRDDAGSQVTLTRDGTSWLIRSFGGGFNEVGEADCWVDSSRL